jgi:hypothetical protein
MVITAAVVVASSSSWWTRHGAHTLLLAIPALIIGFTALVSDVRPWLARRRRDPGTSTGRSEESRPLTSH